MPDIDTPETEPVVSPQAQEPSLDHGSALGVSRRGFMQPKGQDRSASLLLETPQGVRAANSAFEQGRTDELAKRNSELEAQFRGTRAQFYKDPASGLYTQTIDADTQKPLFHATPWEPGATHPEKKIPSYARKNQFGEQEFRPAPIIRGSDPTDEQLYYNFKETGQQIPAGKISDLINHADPQVARLARTAHRQQVSSMWDQALQPMKAVRDTAESALKDATSQRDELTLQMADLNKQIETAPDPATAAGLQATLDQLTQQHGAISQRLRPNGDLSIGARRARNDYGIFSAKASAAKYDALANERRAILKSEGKSEAEDATLNSILTAQQSYDSALRNKAGEVLQDLRGDLNKRDTKTQALTQGEPGSLFQRGVKNVGGVTVPELAKRYGNFADAQPTPGSVLKLHQRLGEIDEMLAKPEALAPKLRQSLDEEKTYLGQLYDQRLARLPEDAQKRLAETIDSQKTTAAGAFGRAMLSSVPGSAGAIAGGETGGAIGALGGPLDPVTVPAGALIGALFGSIFADKGARKLMEKVAPDTYDKFKDLTAKDWEQHPLAQAGGEAAGGLAAFKAQSPAQMVRTAQTLQKLAKGVALTPEETQVAKAFAVQAGMAGGGAVAAPLIEGQPVDPMHALASAAQMMLLGENRFGIGKPKPGKPGGEPPKAATPTEPPAPAPESMAEKPGGELTPDEVKAASRMPGMEERLSPAQKSAAAFIDTEGEKNFRQEPASQKMLRRDLRAEEARNPPPARSAEAPEPTPLQRQIDEQTGASGRVGQSAETSAQVLQSEMPARQASEAAKTFTENPPQEPPATPAEKTSEPPPEPAPEEKASPVEEKPAETATPAKNPLEEADANLRAVNTEYEKVLADYRAKKIGDAEFLTARKKAIDAQRVAQEAIDKATPEQLEARRKAIVEERAAPKEAPIEKPDESASKSAFEEMRRKNRESDDRREAEIQRNLKDAGDGRGVMLQSEKNPNIKILVSPDMNNPGGWRATRYDEKGAQGHTEHKTREEAIRAASGESFSDHINGPAYYLDGPMKVVKTGSPSKVSAPPQSDAATAEFGGKKFTKTDGVWKDAEGQPAQGGLPKILDQRVASKATPTTEKPSNEATTENQAPVPETRGGGEPRDTAAGEVGKPGVRAQGEESRSGDARPGEGASPVRKEVSEREKNLAELKQLGVLQTLRPDFAKTASDASVKDWLERSRAGLKRRQGNEAIEQARLDREERASNKATDPAEIQKEIDRLESARKRESAKPRYTEKATITQRNIDSDYRNKIDALKAKLKPETKQPLDQLADRESAAMNARIDEKVTSPEIAPAPKATADGAKVTPTPAQEKAVSKLADKKQLKVQKDFLADAVKKATDDAPDSQPITDKGQKILDEIDAIRADYSSGDKAKESKANAAAKEMASRVGSYEKGPTETILDNAAYKVKNENGDHLTIEVPGDGTFKIPHSKSALKAFGEVVRKEFGKGLGPHPVDTTMSTKSPGIPGLKKNPNGGDIRESVGRSMSSDETREVLNRVVQDGNFTVATDGRRITVAVGGQGGDVIGKDRTIIGKDGKPLQLTSVSKDAKGKETATTTDAHYPNWRQVIPADYVKMTPDGFTIKKNVDAAINTEVDAGETLRLARLASLATSEKSNSIKIHDIGDGKIGFVSQSPDFGDYHSEGTEGNNKDGTPKTGVVAVNPDFLIDAMAQAREMGAEKVRIIAKDEVSPVIVTDGEKFVSVMMPVRLSSLAEEGARAMPVADATKAVADWRKANPNAPEIKVVNEPSWMENGRGVRGQYRNGELVINSAYAGDASTVAEIANHEWAHDTLASKDGKLALATFATRELPKADLDALKAKYPQQEGESTVDHRLRLAEEWVAKNSEAQPGIFKRIVEAVKGWLSRRGLATLSNEETARAMLRSLRGGEDVGELFNHPEVARSSLTDDTKKSEPAKALRSAQTSLADAWKKVRTDGDLKQIMSADRDAVDTKANAYSREVRNTVHDAVKRSVDGKDLNTAQDALAFYVESGGDAKKLMDMRAKVFGSEKADPKWRNRALAAIDYAMKNGDRLKSPADTYRQFTAQQVDRERAAGLPTLKVDNYVPRYQDIEEGSWLDTGSRTSPTGASNRKVRSYETLADSIAAGVDPKTLNAVDALETRVRTGETGINMRTWQKSLPQYKDGAGEAIAKTPERVERADGSFYYEPGKGYALENVGNTPIAVKKEFSGIVGALTDPSWFSQSAGRLAAQRVNAAAKSFTLAVDTFHLGRLAFRSAMIRGASLTNPKFGPAYKEGLLISEHSPAEIIRMGNSGEIPKESVKPLLESKAISQKLTDVGYNSGRVADAMHQELIQKIPLLGDVNKFIFQKFQRGAMNDAGVLEYKRQRAAYPEMTDEQVARKVSRELMTRFGNLGRQGWFKSQTAQDIARLMFLAPQWNEGLVRSEIGGLKDIGQTAVNAVTGKRAAMGLLGREMLTTGISLFAASQIINQVTRGKFTWENPEEGIAAKLSAFIPDKLGGGSGFFLNPMGLTAETAHLLLNAYERTGNTYEPIVNYIRSRASSGARPLWTFFTGKDSLGRNLKPSEHWKQTALDSIPAPISGGAIVRAAKGMAQGGTAEKFPGEYQKQAMQTFGVRTELAPSPEKRIRGLVTEFNRAHGIEPKGEYYVGEYSELTDALRRENKQDIADGMETLLAKHPAEDIEKYYRTWQNSHFAGSAKRETEFLRTLTPEQKKQYTAARQERTRIAIRAMQAIRGLPAGKRRAIATP